jgi:hypothetical protein
MSTDTFSPGELVTLTPENISAVFVGAGPNGPLISIPGAGTKYVTWERLAKATEAPATVVVQTEDKVEVRDDLQIIQKDVPQVTNFVPDVPARITKKWLSKLTVIDLEAILKFSDLTASRRKRIEEALAALKG